MPPPARAVAMRRRGRGSYLSFLSDTRSLFGSRAVTDSTVLRVPPDAMLALMFAMPEPSDILLTVFAARRRRSMGVAQGGLTLLGATSDRDIRRIARFAARNRIPYRDNSLDGPEAADIAATWVLKGLEPAAILSRDQVITPPTARSVARALGLTGTKGRTETRVCLQPFPNTLGELEGLAPQIAMPATCAQLGIRATARPCPCANTVL